MTSLVALLVLLPAGPPQAQDVTPATPLTLVSPDGRRPVPTTIVSGRELIALTDIASLFRVLVREDALAGGVTLSYRGRTIVASADRPMVSVDGRVVTLPSPVVRSGGRWLVPIEFLSSALAPIYDQRIEWRRTSRLLLLGDVRFPRVSATVEAPGPPTRATITITPATSVTVTAEPGRLLVRIDADALDLAVPPAGAGLIDRLVAGDQPNVLSVGLTPGAGTPRATVTTANNSTRIQVEVPPESRVPGPESRVSGSEPRVPTPESRLPRLAHDRDRSGPRWKRRGCAQCRRRRREGVDARRGAPVADAG